MTDASASFSFPTQIEFGPGKSQNLPAFLSQCGVVRPLVVSDPGFAQTPAFEEIRKALDEAKVSWALATDVHSNPTESDVRKTFESFRKHDGDGVVGVGGGSPLDVAKAVRLMIKRPDLELTRFDWQDDWSGLVPFIAIPTTAGTGSEVGRSAVITPTATQRKAVLFHPELLAAIAILDPKLTIGLPGPLTAATGFDALTHCIESYTSPVLHPLCDGIALEGIRLIACSLPQVMDDPSNVEARGHLQLAAAMGGVAFQKDLGAAHSMAHPLSTLHGLHHGLANALCLSVVMEFNAKRMPGVYRQVAIAMGEDAVRGSDEEADAAAIGAVQKLLAAINIPLGLANHGVSDGDIAALADEATLDPCHQTNPVSVLASDFVDLYRSAL